MGLIDHPTPSTATPLVPGQRLDRATFHNRYEQTPPDFRAELIEGVVFVRTRVDVAHGDMHARVAGWLGEYVAHTLGTRGSCGATLLPDDLAEPEPDVTLRILPAYGGQTRVETGYLAGPPELVIEVSTESRLIDLGPKLRDYERTGVLEYVVIGLEPDEVFWHARCHEQFFRVLQDPDGLFRSVAFPGLWLDPRALFAGDRRRLRAVVETGVVSPGHMAFVTRLAAARKRHSEGGTSP